MLEVGLQSNTETQDSMQKPKSSFNEERADGRATESLDSNTHERTHTLCVLTSAAEYQSCIFLLCLDSMLDEEAATERRGA